MFRQVTIAALFIIMSLSGGCASIRETDEIAYVIGMGLDTAPDEKIEVTYRFARPTVLGTAEGGGGKGEGPATENITIRAKNLAEARNLLKSLVARKIDLSHVEAMVFSEKLARKGLGEILGPLMRFREFRGTFHLAIIYDDSAKNFMLKNDPKFELLTSKYYFTLFRTAGTSGYYFETKLQDVYRDMKSKSRSPCIALMAVSPNTIIDQPIGEKSPPETTEEYSAGAIPREGGNRVEAAGTALFKGNKMVGVLTNEETRILALLRGKLHESFWVVEDPLVKKKTVNIELRPGSKPKINVIWKGGKPIINIWVFMEGEITSIPSGINYEATYKPLIEAQISQVIEQQMKKMIQKTQQLGTDPVGFGYFARHHFRTYQEFSSIDWETLYSQADLNITVKTKIRRTALMGRTTSIK